MYKLKIQMNFGTLMNDDPTARALAKQIVEAVQIALGQVTTQVPVEIEKVTCVNELRKDGRNVLAV